MLYRNLLAPLFAAVALADNEETTTETVFTVVTSYLGTGHQHATITTEEYTTTETVHVKSKSTSAAPVQAFDFSNSTSGYNSTGFNSTAASNATNSSSAASSAVAAAAAVADSTPTYGNVSLADISRFGSLKSEKLTSFGNISNATSSSSVSPSELAPAITFSAFGNRLSAGSSLGAIALIAGFLL